MSTPLENADEATKTYFNKVADFASRHEMWNSGVWFSIPDGVDMEVVTNQLTRNRFCGVVIGEHPRSGKKILMIG